jgi:ADP-heptose:LPS heptosyltransferase
MRVRFGVEVYADAEIDALRDLDGFAAQVAALDLVVSVSNTAVHFAGALNVPVWTLVPKGKGALWYFRLGETTPWYPAMRLFRQEHPGEWQQPMCLVADALRAWAQQRAPA